MYDIIKYYLALSEFHHRCAPRIIRPANFSRRWPLGYALRFWNLGLISPKGIVQLTNSNVWPLGYALCFRIKVSLIPRRYASGIIRPANFSALRFWNLGLIKKPFEETHFLRRAHEIHICRLVFWLEVYHLNSWSLRLITTVKTQCIFVNIQ